MALVRISGRERAWHSGAVATTKDRCVRDASRSDVGAALPCMGGNGVRLFRYLARSRLNTAPVFYRHESDAHSRQLARDKGKNPQNRQGEAILSKNCQGRNQKPNYSEGKDLLLGFIAASLVLPLDRLRPELVLGLLIALVLAESHGVTIPHRPDCQIGLRTPPRHEVHSR
jgi:hypothetical protein